MTLRRLLNRAAAIVVALALVLPPAARAQANDVDAIIDKAVRSVVGLRVEVPQDARSARTLGTERSGHGVVIDSSGLILTVGYLVLEAMAASAVTQDGRVVPAEIVAYDYETGFGLVRPVLPIDLPALPLGDASKVAEQTPVIVAGHGGRSAAMPAVVVSRREFAGYWEYMLDNAIFTSPPYDNWGGAALIGLDGRLLGIGSLFVGDAMQTPRTVPGNMFVPIDLLKPILADLLTDGRAATQPKPWLGVNTQSAHGALIITNVTPGGPAERAGVRKGDVLTEVAGEQVTTIPQFYRKLWSLGAAGVDVPMQVRRDGQRQSLSVKSGDRYEYLQFKRSY